MPFKINVSGNKFFVRSPQTKVKRYLCIHFKIQVVHNRVKLSFLQRLDIFIVIKIKGRISPMGKFFKSRL